MENWTSGTGQRLWVHSEEDCIPYCPIHTPSKHALASAPLHWRGDRRIMERICDHGVGHPDPDDYAVITYEGAGVHGCDGCCRKETDVTQEASGPT